MKKQPALRRLVIDKPLSIAILAMGGQGGGVLADWIVAVAEASGWYAQSTSVPGVAQRTGATLYYIEMLPPKDGRTPILSLMPSPGDVDIVLAAEWMEGGRSILRGLVTPQKTTLIASTHRAFAVAEKEKPGNAIASSSVVAGAAAFAARRVIAFDMEAIASQEGSVVSAPLFGALAAAGVLPFQRQAFEKTIAAGGKGVESSLRAFARGFDSTVTVTPELAARPPSTKTVPSPSLSPAIAERIRYAFPETAHAMLEAGAARLVDFQDSAYAEEYLDRVGKFRALDEEGRNWELTVTAAKYIAIAMAYDDVIAVADRKTRAGRFARVRHEMNVTPGEVVYATEFMHPGIEEIAGLLSPRWGEWLETSATARKALGGFFVRGRRIATFKLVPFLVLYGLAALRRSRRGNLRHLREQRHLEDWLARAAGEAGVNYALAVQVLSARRLVKGYSGTHARGLDKFGLAMAAVPRLSARADGGEWLKRLIAAALADEDGIALRETLRTIDSFA